MTDHDEPPRRAISQRLEFIEWRLFWEGHLNRSDLEERFGISTPQASVDFRTYRETAGDNIVYNATEKRYVATKDIKPKYLKVSANRLLLQLRAWVSGVLKREDILFSSVPAVDVAPEIIRDVRAETLRKILVAIRTRQAIAVKYQSLTSVRWREIAPHALAFDGHRWHARAWCCDREEFRDFVLTRIERLGKMKPVSFETDHDLEWKSKILLKLCPHPELTKEQSQAIQRDYNMKDGTREIEVRLSLAYYFIRRMNLDLDYIDPARSQIILTNIEEVERNIKHARYKSRELIAGSHRSKRSPENERF